MSKRTRVLARRPAAKDTISADPRPQRKHLSVGGGEVREEEVG